MVFQLFFVVAVRTSPKMCPGMTWGHFVFHPDGLTDVTSPSHLLYVLPIIG